jgi:hypothetical protein
VPDPLTPRQSIALGMLRAALAQATASGLLDRLAADCYPEGVAWFCEATRAVAARATPTPPVDLPDGPAAALVAFARLHESWEAALLRHESPWPDAMPDELLGGFLAVQKARNAALAAFIPGGSHAIDRPET